MTQNLGNPIPKDRIVRAIQLIQCIGFLKLNKKYRRIYRRIRMLSEKRITEKIIK
jgi:hypothetical protein